MIFFIRLQKSNSYINKKPICFKYFLLNYVYNYQKMEILGALIIIIIVILLHIRKIIQRIQQIFRTNQSFVLKEQDGKLEKIKMDHPIKSQVQEKMSNQRIELESLGQKLQKQIQNQEGTQVQKSQAQVKVSNQRIELDALGQKLQNKNQQLTTLKTDILTLETKLQSKTQIFKQQEKTKQRLHPLIDEKQKQWKIRQDKIKQQCQKRNLSSKDSKVYFQILQQVQPKFKQLKKKSFGEVKPKKIEQLQYKPYISLQQSSQGKKIQFKINICDNNNNEKKLEQISVNQAFIYCNKLISESPQIAANLYSAIVNVPIKEKDLKQDRQVRTILQKKIKTNPNCVQNVALLLANELQQQGISVHMSKKTSIRSQLCMSTLTGQLANFVKCTQKIQDEDKQCPYTFDQLSQDFEKLKNFEAWYRMKIQRDTGINGNKIVIHNIFKGSIKVQWSTNQSDKLNQSFETNAELENKLKLHPFFQHFNLSPQDFDERGNIEFPNDKSDVQFRGGWPYYQPIKCKRYGLNISKKYDDGNDQWLLMNGNPGQWAVAFHGVRSPDSFCNNNIKVMNSIMSGLDTGQMLMAGGGQAYQNAFSVNRQKQYVGNGIYCSPHIQESLNGYTGDIKIASKLKPYRLVFQCRVNPKKIKVCNYQAYWVLNQSKDIRPYGVILIKNDIVSIYPNAQSQFKQTFTYGKYKEKIEKFQRS